jgi:hypothetical protein
MIDRKTRAVILEHRVNGRGIGDGLEIIGVILGAHCLGRSAIPGQRICQDRPLGLFRLRIEKPVPPAPRELLATPFERLEDGNPIKHREPADTLRMVHRQAKGGIGTTVMSRDIEAVMAEFRHELGEGRRFRTFR